MATRHRIPTIFNIYMVDVLCCALGCVILLWQLYHHESEEQAAAAQEQTAIAKARLKKLEEANLSISALTSDVEALKITLDAANKKRVQVTLELEDTRKDRDKFEQLALVRKKEYDDLKKVHAAAEAVLAMLRLDFKSLEKKSALTAAELTEKIRAHAELFDKLAAAEKKLRALTQDLAATETDAKLAAKTAAEKSNLLAMLEKELSILRGQGKLLEAKLSTAGIRAGLLEQDLEKSKKELFDVNRRFQDLLLSQDTLTKRYQISVKDLDRAKELIAALDLDKKSWIKKARDIQTAADNRFAGITLTGSRVIILVDMSGSMELIDEATADPDKWPLVCETIAKVMRSLTDLKQYQVILFSDQILYPMGSPGRWLEYKSEADAKTLAATLIAIRPKGGTNMAVAFEEAFRFRDQGLDTIYVFSDGLPNQGPGVKPDSKLTESQKTELLSKHIRSRLKNNLNPSQSDRTRVRINTVGFFFESPDVGAFLWALARENDGSFVGMSRP
ncbi:MAG: VWA domain-containing protein [Gemmataceae bacterium]|nr:VWA domain-containing protein [Gemmataceae bacterium]MCI0739228.1 VWA domain-containing protein [Gemmataceae bacterium]